MLLGLDLGTTNVKAVLVDRHGHLRATASRPTPFVDQPGGGVEMEPDALGRTLAEVLSGLGPDRGQVAGIGVAGMAESGFPLAEGWPLGPIIAWFDGRGDDTVADLNAALGPDFARRIGQRPRSVSSVAKLGWLLSHGMPLPQRWLGVPEVALFLLTGAEATEYSLAARTGAYDVVAGQWMPEVIDVLGVSPDIFPAVRAAGETMGLVGEAASARYGLPAGVPVTIAGHDHLAAVESLGLGEAVLANSIGTAETLLRRTTDVPDVDEALRLGLAVTVRPGGTGWVVLASATRSGLVIDRLAAELDAAPAELDKLAEEVIATGSPVPDQSDLVERARTGEEALLASPGSPGPGASPGVVWAGVLQALVARSAGAAARMAELVGPASRLVVFGGGSRSRPWLALKAGAAGGIPVDRVTVSEAVARGAALAGGVAAGWWPSMAVAPPAPVEPAAAAGG